MLQARRLNKIKSEKGGLLVEIVVVVGIIVGSLVAILGLATTFLVTSQIVQQTSQATALAQEGLEIVRNYRDGIPWNTDPVPLTWEVYDGLGVVDFGDLYYVKKSMDVIPQWQLLKDPVPPINEFTREIVFEEVQRDGNDDINPGTVDPDTVKAIVTVSWEERGRSHVVELEAYFTNWN
ncbi:MAG TPA: hypothetical protein VJC15_04065 [Candidatus Paceibacterota bacterium]